VRNLDWLNPQRFYTKLAETSPNSAKSLYSIGVLRSADGNDVGATEAYDRAIAMFPAYAEAYRNKGNALARLGRRGGNGQLPSMPALCPRRLLPTSCSFRPACLSILLGTLVTST